jgi:hypothetical protein
MKNRIIFELKLNLNDSIIAYEKKNYETCYEDSLLYININGKKTKIVESSFCYGFGAEMYYRIYNIKDFCESSKFDDGLKDFYNSLTYNDNYDPSDPKSKPYFVSTDFLVDNYDFANGNVYNNFEFYLYKNKNEYVFLFVKLWENKTTKKYEAKILNEFRINEKTFLEWKQVISSEWEKRVMIDGDNMAQANSRQKNTMEEWQQYFEYMRSDN